MVPKGLANRDDCTGCGACRAACPVAALALEADSEGFLYPRRLEGCTDCGLCAKACPVRCAPSFHPALERVQAAWCRADEERMKASSGGIFRVLVRYMLGQGGIVFGAAFDPDFRLRHTGADTAEGCAPFSGSKYVQSDTALTYREARDALRQGRPVLYSGTPCQIAGLYAFLGGDHERLITCEVLCDGVPSPSVFARYVALIEQKNHGKLRALSFKDKRKNWRDPHLTAVFDNGRVYSHSLFATPYGHGFGATLFLRPVCARCAYARPARCADITLGDFWGLGKEIFFPHDTRKGVSLVLFNSEKARALKLPPLFESAERSFDEAATGNERLLRPLKHNPKRAAFFADSERLPFDALMRTYCTALPAPLRLTAKLLSPEAKARIKGFLGK